MTQDTARAIVTIEVTPTIIPGNQPTQIKVTAYVGGLEPKAVRNVSLLDAQDDWGRPNANLGPMYDDGTHGDQIAGDKIYTTQVTLQGREESYFYLRTHLQRRWLPWPVQSDTFATITVYGPNSAEHTLREVADILRTGQTENLEPWVSNANIMKKIREMDASTLRRFPAALLTAQTIVDKPGVKIFSWQSNEYGNYLGYMINITKAPDGTWKVSEWTWDTLIVD